jgi:2-polyprenyl-3-methyl-5-hydroxy-6-metoxy-1,4-benzoquinol methylase
MPLNSLSTVEEVDAVIDVTNRMANEEDRIKVLCDNYYNGGRATPPSDPLSPEYRDFALGVYSSISGRSYEQSTCELSPFLPEHRNLFQLPPYEYKSSDMLGEFLITYGFIIRTMHIKGGAKVLEYGAGNGQILLQLARIGCEVTAIDIDPRYIELIRLQAEAMAVSARAIVGTFDSTPPEPPYDVVLFFEAFHHCLNHIGLIQRISSIVKDDGILVFSGEPIIPLDSYWRPTIPYPWGPRLDLLSVRAMKAYGWMELGFQEEYFYQLLESHGWHVTKYPCSLTGRADTWVARRG